MMSSAISVPPKASRVTDLIWLGEADPDGRPLDPSVKELAYKKQGELARYRANEMTDQAQVASLIEEAAYRTSRVATERCISDPGSYLFRTYTNLVDATLRRTVKLFGIESQVLAEMAKTVGNPEQGIVKDLTRQRVLESMDEVGRGLWERHLLGYELDELAAEEGQSQDYLGKRLRRAIQRALRRLYGGAAESL